MAARREDLGEYIVLPALDLALLAVLASTCSADRVPSYRAGIVAAWSKLTESIRRAMLALIG